METEEGTSNADNAEHAEPDRCLNSGVVNNGVTIDGGNDVAEGGEVWGLKNEVVNNGVAIEGGKDDAEGGEVRGLKNEDVNNGLAMTDGNGFAEGGEGWGSKNEDVNNGLVITDGNGVAEGGEVQGSKNEDVNNGLVITDGNGVAEGGEVRGSKNEDVNNGLAITDGNGVAEGGEGWGSKNEAVNNGVVIADDGNGVAKGEGFRCLKKRTVDNGVAIVDGFGVAEGYAGGVECFRTYKRRKHVKSSSESKIQEGSRERVEAASHLSDQAVKKPCDLAVGNTSKDYSHGHWGNVVLKHLYHSLGNENGGMERCMWEALVNCPKISCATTVTETLKIDKDGQECSSEFEWLSRRLQSEANGHTNVMSNGFSTESDGHGATERCQRVFCNILASEKFSLLCKVLLESFKGMKPESVFDFSVINSRMKEQAYEQSPTLFLSDIQQVWRKLQDTGNEIVAIAKSLSNMSKASYHEQFSNQEFNSPMKPEQTEECATYKICTCRLCGDKADGTDCLVCDSCEKMYHVSCIEPAVKEIPYKNWFCASCTASGIGSRHENCVVCERLSVPKTMNIIVGEESIPTNEETLNELEENSNCTHDEIQVSIGGGNSASCKICGKEVDGEKIKICGHPFCPSKYYHLRCLSSKQTKLYGHCWYCPSCLCQVCFTDQDDDKIVLCDGCDDAYHVYCMKPPQTSIPRGKWFCRNCDSGIQAIHQAKKAYESSKRRAGENVSNLNDDIGKKWKNKQGRELDKVGGMDMLLTAANTLNFEENLSTIQIDSQRT